MTDFKEKIRQLYSSFKAAQDNAANGWDDDNKKRFYGQYLEPMENDAKRYADKLDEYVKMLERSKREIDAMLSESSSQHFGGSPNERGDRAGGKSSQYENNPNFANTFFNNNTR